MSLAPSLVSNAVFSIKAARAIRPWTRKELGAHTPYDDENASPHFSAKDAHTCCLNDSRRTDTLTPVTTIPCISDDCPKNRNRGRSLTIKRGAWSAQNSGLRSPPRPSHPQGF